MRLFFTALFFLIFCSNCKKDSSSEPLPLVNVTEAESITKSSADIGISLITVMSSKVNPVTSYGVCWALHDSPTINDSIRQTLVSQNGEKGVSYRLNNLTGHTTYYLKGFAIFPKGVVYSNRIYFTTL